MGRLLRDRLALNPFDGSLITMTDIEKLIVFPCSLCGNPLDSEKDREDQQKHEEMVVAYWRMRRLLWKVLDNEDGIAWQVPIVQEIEAELKTSLKGDNNGT